MTTLLEPKTYLPSENAGVAEIDDLLHSGDAPTFALVNGSHSVALPAEINNNIARIVTPKLNDVRLATFRQIRMISTPLRAI